MCVINPYFFIKPLSLFINTKLILYLCNVKTTDHGKENIIH